MTAAPPAMSRLLRIAMVLTLALSSLAAVAGVGALRSASASQAALEAIQESNQRADDRRVVAIDAAQTSQQQQACAARTNAAALTAIIDAVLAGARSDEDLAAALEQLRPIREQLASVGSRCFDDNPVPDQPAEAGP